MWILLLSLSNTKMFSFSDIDAMLNMIIGDVIKLVDVSGIDEKQMVELVEVLREAFQQWVIYLYRLLHL